MPPSELKPCPFCGKEAIMTSYAPLPNTLGWYPKEYGDGTGKCYQVFCTDTDCQCGRGQLNVVGYYTQEVAIERWNTRPAPDGLRRLDRNKLRNLIYKLMADEDYSFQFTGPRHHEDILSHIVDSICSTFGVQGEGLDYGDLEEHIATHLEQGTHIPKEDIPAAVRLIMISVRQEVKSAPARQGMSEQDILAIIKSIKPKTFSGIVTFEQIAQAIHERMREKEATGL